MALATAGAEGRGADHRHRGRRLDRDAHRRVARLAAAQPERHERLAPQPREEHGPAGAQRRPGAAHELAHGALAGPHDARDLVVGTALDRPQHQRPALAVGQLLQALGQAVDARPAVDDVLDRRPASSSCGSSGPAGRRLRSCARAALREIACSHGPTEYGRRPSRIDPYALSSVCWSASSTWSGGR